MPWICKQCGEQFEEDSKEVEPYGKYFCHVIACDDGHGEPEPCPCGPVEQHPELLTQEAK